MHDCINKTNTADSMLEKWSKFCKNDKQLEAILDSNTLTGEIVDVIGIFVVLKSGYEDFRTEVSIDQLKKCSEPRGKVGELRLYQKPHLQSKFEKPVSPIKGPTGQLGFRTD